jgi:hypothetical protein
VRCGVRKNAMVTGSVEECMAVGGRPGGVQIILAPRKSRESAGSFHIGEVLDDVSHRPLGHVVAYTS